ncbi:MAG: AAA family ATPase [Planctomycetota bacterium]
MSMESDLPATGTAAERWDLRQELADLQSAIRRIYRGAPEVVDLLLTAFLAGGHVLLEDIPGVGKTTLGKALAGAIGGELQRLQCTPDLMPADITGVSIYSERDRSFVFHRGPVFCDVLLADELNRTPPRTQSALLEAMNEGQVTVDGCSHPLAPCFFCVATQNPHDHVGTYPLPESQKDRFLLCFTLGYPQRERERELLAHDGAEDELAALEPVLNMDTATALRSEVRAIAVREPVADYILDIIAATRADDAVAVGASPRAAIGLKQACQARALLAGRGFVIPEDVQQLAVPALAHRIRAKAGQDASFAIQALLEGVPVPR